MKRLLPVAVLLGLVAGMAGMSAAQASTSGGNGNKSYTCSNQGGGPNHSVVCNGTLSGNNVTINVLDQNVLSDVELGDLAQALDATSDTIVGLAPAIEVEDLQACVVSTYLTDFHIVLTVNEVEVTL